MNLRCAGLLTLGLLLIAGCGDPPVDDTVLIVAETTSIHLYVPADGYLEATDASPIAVPRVPTGALQVKDLAREGTLVKKGDVVVTFDDTKLNIDLENHRASFASSEQRLTGNDLNAEIAEGTLSVMREVAELERDNVSAFQIVDTTIYSKQEMLEDEVRLDDAEETIVFADASIQLRGEFYEIEERILDVEKEQVSGNISRVETSLGNMVLRSPLSGLVLYRKNWRGASVGVGDSLFSGNVIMSIVDPDSAALTAFVAERDAARIEKGADAEVRIDARPGHVFAGKVDHVAELSRPIERGSPVKFTEIRVALTDVPAGLLKPGMKGTAQVSAGRVEDRIVVPRAALRGEGEQQFVVVAENGQFVRRPVVPGTGDRVRVVIDEGLAAGERVVLGDVELARDSEDASSSPDAG
ncbi:MAG: efflux RND transporter periplasmic adaptor subunit [Acidobacteriota bacterium]|nr:efflux RND transporter periplasmic adaptor subunit [Acidobacteriota bacterium]MDH3784155.1 efflux RND transporter periplasmic adaptor subunit [Acidobacteriota bacterium]